MNQSPTPVSNAFSEVLAKHRNGELLNELSHAIQEATQGVKEHCKQASIHLEIIISPATGDASSVLVSGEVKVKLPKAPKASSLFYPTDDNLLVKSDPNQREMVLQEIVRPPAVDPIVLGQNLANANTKSAAS